jgi:DNA-binding response OmpR family regulator
MSRVLVVEDETHLAEGLRFNLQAEKHQVEVSSDGESALERLLNNEDHFDAVVLDVMLPGKDGFAVVSALRRAKNYVPVLMLTARGRPEDVLQGFAAGADDYLPKPFQLPIFLARLQGLLRRSQWLRQPQERSAETAGSERADRATASGTDETTFSFGGKTIDFANLELRANGNVVHLTLMEAKLLRHLASSKGQTVSRKSILEDVWGVHEDTDTRAIDNFIVRLRRYIEKEPSEPVHLLTVRGIGYRFIAERAAEPAAKRKR